MLFINVLSLTYNNAIFIKDSFLFFTNISFKMLEFNPLYYKKNHVWKYHLISLFSNFIKDFFSFRSCSTKGAAQLLRTAASETSSLWEIIADFSVWQGRREGVLLLLFKKEMGTKLLISSTKLLNQSSFCLFYLQEFIKSIVESSTKCSLI